MINRRRFQRPRRILIGENRPMHSLTLFIECINDFFVKPMYPFQGFGSDALCIP